jgi:hypothetical protein
MDNMPPELKHLADQQPCPRRTHDEMERAADRIEAWKERERVRVADAKARGVSRIYRRGDDNPAEEVGFYGKSVLYQLEYFDFARCQRTDMFHHLVGEMEAIFTLVLNRDNYWSLVKAKFCSAAQYKLRKLYKETKKDGKQVAKLKFPPWRAKKDRIALIDALIRQLKWYEGVCSKMLAIDKDFASYKGHDWHMLAGDAGIYLIKMYNLSPRMTYLLCSLVRVVENSVRRDIKFRELKPLFDKTVRLFVECEMALPLDFNRFVHHKQLHTFAPHGYIHDLGSGSKSWMYPEERMMSAFKSSIHSRKNAYASMARNHSLLQSVMYLRSAMKPEEFAICNPSMSSLNFMTDADTPDWYTKKATMEWGSTPALERLSSSEKRDISRFIYLNVNCVELNIVREKYKVEVPESKRKQITMMKWAETTCLLTIEEKRLCYVPDEVEAYSTVYVSGVKFRTVGDEKGLSTCNSHVKIEFQDRKNHRDRYYYGIIQKLYSFKLRDDLEEVSMVKAYWMNDLDHKVHTNEGSFLRRVTKGTVSQHKAEPYALVQHIFPGNVLFWPRNLPHDGRNYYVIERNSILNCECAECASARNGNI